MEHYEAYQSINIGSDSNYFLLQNIKIFTDALGRFVVDINGIHISKSVPQEIKKNMFIISAFLLDIDIQCILNRNITYFSVMSHAYHIFCGVNSVLYT